MFKGLMQIILSVPGFAPRLPPLDSIPFLSARYGFTEYRPAEFDTDTGTRSNRSTRLTLETGVEIRIGPFGIFPDSLLKLPCTYIVLILSLCTFSFTRRAEVKQTECALKTTLENVAVLIKTFFKKS